MPGAMTITAPQRLTGRQSKPYLGQAPATHRRTVSTGTLPKPEGDGLSHRAVATSATASSASGVMRPMYDANGNEIPAMYPAPFFIPMPMVANGGEFPHMPFDLPFPPEMFALYHPNMPMLVPFPSTSVESGGSAAFSAPVSSPIANQQHESSPKPIPTFEPPQFGPGPPIVTGDRLKGPRGCNLFVFHLPNEITNWDLYLLFRRHGTILSVHIMVNKATGLSKGYGFVSFANKEDASTAIEAMDGFRLGKKRLKVQLKRLQDDNMEGGWDDPNENDLSQSLHALSTNSSSANTPSAPTDAAGPTQGLAIDDATQSMGKERTT